MNAFVHRVLSWARTSPRKALAMVLAVTVVGYLIYSLTGSSATETRYILTTVEKGTLAPTVSGVGQVGSSDQMDVKPKVAAEITSVAVVAGQEVMAGEALAYLDAADATQSVQNARIALENARITLQKLQQNKNVGTLTSQEDLASAYEGAFNGMTTAFLKLPDVMETARGMLYDNTLDGVCSSNACEYSNLVHNEIRSSFSATVAGAESDYEAARASYESALAAYSALRADASHDEINRMLATTGDALGLISQALKSERSVLDGIVVDINQQALLADEAPVVPAQITAYRSALSSALSSVNAYVTDVSARQRSITTAQRSIDDAVVSDPLDIASQTNAVAQRVADLANAQRTLANHVVRAPFDGVVAKVNSKKGDTVGASTAIATVMSHKKLVTFSLNEVDVAKVVLGQKATLTFDAITDLTMTGTVAEVDAIGTTSQGVVNYTVTVALDTQDDRIRPGMSTSVSVILGVHNDVLTVPSTAVKTQSGSSYVLVLDNVTDQATATTTGVASAVAPRKVTVEVGVSDDASTEITSGLTEGQQIVLRSITSASTTTKTQSGSVLPGVGGNSVRALGR